MSTEVNIRALPGNEGTFRVRIKCWQAVKQWLWRILVLLWCIHV